MNEPLQSLEKLNAEFAIADVLRFEPGVGGFIVAKIKTAYAVADVCLYGAQVISFIPHNLQPVLWVSPNAVHQAGKAIRGGVPVCWPWFSAHPSDPSLPSHGFARISQWQVIACEHNSQGHVQLQLALPGDVDCLLTATVSDCLDITLHTKNTTGADLVLSEALHSYLQVADIKKVQLLGLDGCQYIDDVSAEASNLQRGNVVFAEEVDRRYSHSAGDVLIQDISGGRSLRIAKRGSANTIVWNPWSNRAATIGDMPDDGYLTMLCVEAGNTGKDSVLLGSGESHLLGTTISVEAVSC